MSTEPKMTPWFVNGEKPAREGVYQQRNGNRELGYQRWTGSRWMFWSATVSGAQLADMPAAGEYQNDPWRGLASKP